MYKPFTLTYDITQFDPTMPLCTMNFGSYVNIKPNQKTNITFTMNVKADNGKKIVTGTYKIIIINKNVVIPIDLEGDELPIIPPGRPLTKRQSTILIPSIPSTLAQMIKGLPPGKPAFKSNIPGVQGNNLEYTIMAGTVENLITPLSNLDDKAIRMVSTRSNAPQEVKFLKFENRYRKLMAEPKLSDIGTHKTSMEFRIRYRGDWQKKTITINVLDPRPPANFSSV